MPEIRIYVEGGGDGVDSKAALRQGMDNFLKELKNLARHKGVQWKLITCGPRNKTFRDFQTALKSHPDAFNLLLVDAEAPFTSGNICQHLQNRDKWPMSTIDEIQCHLMVEVMENWLMADVDALAQFYGQNFNRQAIPNTQNVEQVPKDAVEAALTDATRRTQKGRYHKIQHGPKLLGLVDVSTVRHRAPACDRLFITLIDFINRQ